MININNLNYGYNRKRNVFTNLTLNIKKGHIYGLLGKNGAGKTTMLKLICGLLYPTSGSIDVLGNTPAHRNPEFLNNIFFIPEEFTMPHLTPSEYAENYGVFYPKFNMNQFLEIAKKLDLNPNETMHTMSFGQQKKSYISFAIACNTSILIMDEPTNGLDIPSKAAFRRVIASEMNDDRTIVISTHQVRELNQLIDNVIILDNSEILLNSSLDNITNKLTFKRIENDETPLYSEQTPQGLWGVVDNHDNSESQIDMEILFNAAIFNKQLFINALNK